MITFRICYASHHLILIVLAPPPPTPGAVSAVEISPVLPRQSGEKEPENLTRWLLESLLTFMVSEVSVVGLLQRYLLLLPFTGCHCVNTR